jgi:hypothetical protein
VEVAEGRKLHFADWVMALAVTLFVLARQGLLLFDGFGFGSAGPEEQVPAQPGTQISEEASRA